MPFVTVPVFGIIYDSQGRHHEAIRAYQDSLELDIHQPNLLLNLGSSYMRQERFKPAMESFEQAARQAPGDAQIWEQMAVCRYRMGEIDKAVEMYEKAVALDAHSASAQRGLGVALMSQYLKDSGRQELRDKALAAWNASLDLNPNQQDLTALVQKYSPPAPQVPRL